YGSSSPNFSGSTSASAALTLTAATTTTTVTNAGSLSYGSSLIATVGPASATGNLQFQVDGSNFGSSVAVIGGTAYSLPLTIIGSQTLAPSYASSGPSFSGSTSASVPLTVTAVTTTTTLTNSGSL